MIGRLRGRLVARSPRGEATVEVGGIGYRVSVSPATLAALGPTGAEVVVHTHLHVREDALTLYGFPAADERDCFEALLGAHGVGPALALAIVSVHPPSQLRRVLVEGDLDALTLVPGVGRKTAARLLIELKARLDVPESDLAAAGVDGNGAAPLAELRVALAGLGYEAEEVRRVAGELPADGDLETLLRSALRLLAASR
ncbi:MAG: Holliday junction branch migration protein RuvA [Actinomycetota bacterium]|nr:Holliday junction branch migration protein RuvA [Actinomycetota bacterium]